MQKLTILFDLDGTLVDSAPDLMNAHNHVMKKFGYETKTKEDIRNLAGKGASVMIGRSIYQNPYSLVEIEKEIFKTNNNPSREEVVKKLLEYLDTEVKKGTKVNHIMRHTVGLYHGQVGSKEWKRYLSDNMMARDSDFQKAKHIMTIVQNNEKANQVSS